MLSLVRSATPRLFLVSALFFYLGLMAATADVALKDPEIPSGETIVYKLSVGSDVSALTEVTKITTIDEKDFYEVVTESKTIDTVALVLKPLYQLRSLESLLKSSAANVKRLVSLAEKKTALAVDEIGMLDPQSLVVLLRGFPFEELKAAKLVSLGTDASPFSFVITNLGKETLKVGGKEYQAYKLQMGLSGPMDWFVPKTFLWFSAEKPHYLLRYEGTSAGPGSPNRILELSEYRVNP